MRALSLWEFWATGMREGVKKNETRGWYMSYRGDLVICAAKRRMPPDELALYRAESLLYRRLYDLTEQRNTFGHALCVVEVYDCVPTKNFMRNAVTALLPLRRISEQEYSLGNYAPGRFAIMTRNLRVLKTPVPVRGRQSLFDLSPEEEKAVRAQLENT